MLKLQDKMPGQQIEPLETITIVGAEKGTLTVSDALGREYFRAPAGRAVSFTVGGALGWHAAVVADGAGKALETLRFRVRAQTAIQDQGGQFSDLMRLLLATMLRFGEGSMTIWRNRIYRYFVCWLRDHVHTLKGMKYFYGIDLTGSIDLYRLSQKPDGMIWDNNHPRNNNPGLDELRFGYDGFIQVFEDGTADFKRIPVENDVEYLYIEGIYYTWKAVGDDAWMSSCLDSAIKAMEYSVTSPYRWSEKYQLLKRGYTIDTWDFQNDEDAKLGAAGNRQMQVFGDAMAIRVGHTRFGVMYGDNTGYIAGCRYLAEMLQQVGRDKEAKKYLERADQMKQRLDKLAWNGKFYTHQVPEDPNIKRDLGVDEKSQVSLSNAYSVNRGLTHEQCVAIIKTYLDIRNRLPAGSPGEWYTIFPPFEKGYGGHNSKWQYMNSSVTPIVAGELAHGAFENGFEEYGVEILRRMLSLGQSTCGHLHCSYTGSIPPAPQRTFQPVDLKAQANADFCGAGAAGVPGWTGEGDNDLHEMPTGRQTIAGIEFGVIDPASNGRRACIGLSTQKGYCQRAEIPVSRKAASIYFLHAASALPSVCAGRIIMEYQDGQRFCQDVITGQHICGWWSPSVGARHRGGDRCAVAWRGKNVLANNIGLVAFGLNNPCPDKAIGKIVLECQPAGGFWMVAGITLSDKPAWFPVDPVSFGIPDNWGAAAVVYALVEGLAGVKDTGVAFDRVLLAPRWPAAGVDSVKSSITYPASDGYVAYDYKLDRKAKKISMALTASGDKCRCHILLPAGVSSVKAVKIDNKDASFAAGKVENSLYADFDADGPVLRNIEIEYS
ncbi:MAG: hypothetical protein HZA50_12225 [Planctomycetes bacterium]|nr:hypothetical protein [Planctomycetota bacterium]